MTVAHKSGSRWRRGLCLAGVALLSPRLGLRRFLPRPLLATWDRLLLGDCRSESLGRSAGRTPSLNWRGFDGCHADGRVGPIYRGRLTLGRGEGLRVEAEGVAYPMPDWLRVRLVVDGEERGCWALDRRGRLSVELSPGAVGPGEHEVELHSSAFVIPHEWNGGDDHRPLSLLLHRLEPLAA